MKFKVLSIAIIYAGAVVTCVESLYLTGHLRTKKNWEFLGRFCFLSDLGRLKFAFTYPHEKCCYNILLYTDNDDQWATVYKNYSKTCADKESVLRPENHEVINLTMGYEWSGCHITNKIGARTLECSGERSFGSVRERWWYIAISNCQGKDGLDVSYEMSLTNGNSFWTQQFSADEFGILEMNIVFFVACMLMLANAMRAAAELANRQMLHTTYKIFLACLGVETFCLLLLSVAYGTFAADGIGHDGITILGELLGACSEVGFLVMLLLVAKGYTITRGQLSQIGSIKLTVFSTIYGVISIVLFLYEYVFSDPGLVLYVYESPAGYGIITLRMMGWFWFTYSLIFTVKHYPEKAGFYYRLFLLYSIWFFAVPMMVLISSYIIPKYMRSKIVNALELCIDFVAYFTFMILTRPAAANSNFPYHVRTSQIGIIMPNGRMETLADFPHSVYAETDLNGRRVSSFADLFSADGPLERGSEAIQGDDGKSKAHNIKDPNCEERNSVTTVDHHTQHEASPDPSRSGKAEVCAEENTSGTVKLATTSSTNA